MDFDTSGWPLVPEEDRPRLLPHDGRIDPDAERILCNAGWQPKDYRSMPSDTIEHRREAVLAWLEGMRMGTIKTNNAQLKAVELEMRAVGLHIGKLSKEKHSKLEDNQQDLDTVLDFAHQLE